MDKKLNLVYGRTDNNHVKNFSEFKKELEGILGGAPDAGLALKDLAVTIPVPPGKVGQVRSCAGRYGFTMFSLTTDPVTA